jgi:hypothetical protein
MLSSLFKDSSKRASPSMYVYLGNAAGIDMAINIPEIIKIMANTLNPLDFWIQELLLVKLNHYKTCIGISIVKKP